MTIETEDNTVNFIGDKVLREHCPLSGLKCCCERHVCKARKYHRLPYDRNQKILQPPSLGLSNVPFDGQTTQKTSYIPYDTQKPVGCKPSHGIQLNVGNFEKITTHKMSFPNWHTTERTYPIPPCRRHILGTGPLQATTNQKTDYCIQPYSKRPTFKITSNLFCKGKPIDGRTTNKLSYGPPPENFVLTKKFQSPKNAFTKICTPMVGTSSQKTDYIEWKPAEKVNTDLWNGRVPFVKPKIPMQNSTMYSHAFKPSDPRFVQETSRKTINKYNTITDDNTFYDTTMYGTNYSNKFVPPERIGKKSMKTSIHFGNKDKFDGESTHSMVYRPWNAKPNVISTPLICSNTLRKSGPMDLITTNKQDFNTKPYSKRPLKYVAKINSLQPSNKPLDCRTTSGLSYHPQIITERPPLIKPIPVICPSDEKFDGDTMYKKSFLPWVLSKREPYLASPDKFIGIKFEGPFHGATTYRNSYLHPARIIEDECDKPCGCKYPTQCLDIK